MIGFEIGHGSFARAFNCARSTVGTAPQKGCDESKRRRRHLAADAESEATILADIQRDDEKNTPRTRTEIHHDCSTTFNKEMTKG
jgi:hypothetical protein